MSAISSIRHFSIFDASKFQQKINLIGAGATGSRAFAALVEAGVTNIDVYDADIVEAHNLANQIYGHSDLGIPKVEALRNWYKWKTGENPPKHMNFFQQKMGPQFPAVPLSGFVFLLTDSMHSRKLIYNIYLHAEQCGNIERVIDTRMASLHGNVMHFNPNDPEKAKAWYDTLTDDESTELSPCGLPISVGTTATLLANMAVQQYMWLCENPAGCDDSIRAFFRPLHIG